MSYGIYLYRQDATGLVDADRKAVCAALARWGWDGSEESPYLVGTPDGHGAEFWAKELHGGGRFVGGNLELRGFGTVLCRLILDLAKAGPFSISHDGDSGVIILVSEGQRANLPPDLANDPKVMVCETAEELEAAIDGGFERWREFRDAACGRPRGAKPS
jgi:hypothetical protein